MIAGNMEKKENSTVQFEVTVDKGEFEAAINRAYIKNRAKINVPGFRKGKAPRMIIEGMYGAGVFHDDAAKELSMPAFEFGVDEFGLETVGRPMLMDMDISEDKALTLTFETAVYPEVKLGEYKGVTAPKKPVEVTEAEIDARIESERKKNARVSSVDRPAKNGDTAVIDFDGYLDGEPFQGGKGEKYSLVLGSGQFVPGFEEQVVGMSPGGEREINLVFPEQYHEHLAGKAVVFKVKLHEVKESELPEADDEFAKDISEFDTLAEYRDSIKKELLEQRGNESDARWRDTLICVAADNIEAEIPEPMVEEKQTDMVREFALNLSYQGISMEEYLKFTGMDYNGFVASARPDALQAVKNDLMLRAVVKAEEITVPEEEIEAEYEKLSERYGQELEKIKEMADKEAVSMEIKLRKARDIICAEGIEGEWVEHDAAGHGEEPSGSGGEE